MKKYIRLTMLFFLFFDTTLLFAQRRIDLALKPGISIPDLTSGNSADPVSNGYSSRLGFDAAIAVEWHLSKRFSLAPQLEYSQQGGKKNGLQAFTVPPDLETSFPAGQAPPYLYADYKSTAKINYLMLPVLARYYLTIRQNWQSYIAAGPFASVLLSAHNVTSGSSLVYLDEKQTQPLSADAASFDSNDNVKEDLHACNAGISGYIGLAYNVHSGSIFVEGGGNYGLVNIQKDAANGTNKTGAAVISLGYQFRL